MINKIISPSLSWIHMDCQQVIIDTYLIDLIHYSLARQVQYQLSQFAHLINIP